MHEILFKQNEALVNDQEQFSVENLFSQPVLANGLHRMMPPTALNNTPREIYDQVK